MNSLTLYVLENILIFWVFIDMKIIFEEGSVRDLIDHLENDLLNIKDLKALARLPEPSRGRRYRDVLYSTFIRLGYVTASVILEFKDGLVKSYVFIGRVIPFPGQDNYLEMPIYTEGYLVEKSRGSITYRHYNPYVFKSGKALFKRIKELGDKFRLSDLEVYLERISEYLEYDETL